MSRLQKVNFFVRGQANSDSVRCDGCNYLKSLAVRLSPLAVICEFRLLQATLTVRESGKDNFLPISKYLDDNKQGNVDPFPDKQASH